ncbi:DUF6518 family protein [Alicyclobacillus acidiphilus]|uniref:DUF6518 family protein n=1 Tax=Alicyclobacillus acidiphilus TaxID=182455 RepID=UPI000829C287|nr:DUF6518 family protein [Alicyclobacillus acidiphilus]
MMPSKRRMVAIVSVSLCFGAMMSIIKGNDAGLRDAIGNISAPWLLLPFMASVYAKEYQPVHAALTGFLASICALMGFYVANSFVLDLGPHPWLVDLALTLPGMRFWSLLSVFSGPCFGLLGAWYVRRRALTPALLTALLLVFEPFTWKIYDFGDFRSYPVLSLTETTVGLVACAVLVIRFKLSQRR